MSDYLKKEDYEESCCPLRPDKAPGIPAGRVLGRLDEYLNRGDYEAAERHLSYWLGEAQALNDDRGRLTVLNEQIGLFRKLGKKDEGLKAVSAALELVEKSGADDGISTGTTLVNAATALNAFEKAEEAFKLYRRAREIYEKRLSPDDERLGGLYNNMALAAAALGDHAGARELYAAAWSVMEKQEHPEPELAITCLNLADLEAAEKGQEQAEKQIEAYLKQAERLLDADGVPRDGYYAFVCEKCAPVFGYYGFFAAEKKFRERAAKIYEGH